MDFCTILRLLAYYVGNTEQNGVLRRERKMDLVVLAAGMGSRFGGLKQIQPIDEDKNFIIDYSIYDAIKAGFDRVIFIIKEENYEIFRQTIGNRLSAIVPVEYAFQRLEDVPGGTVIPEGRIKPWGTAHAIYAVRDIVGEKFAIINADDFYGYQSFKLMADFLKNNDSEFVNIGFFAKNTLSDKGAVKRGILHTEDGYVNHLVESSIERRGADMWATPIDEDSWEKIGEETLVSMNMFGFNRTLMNKLARDCMEFFGGDSLEKGEWLIPMVVDEMVHDGEIRLRVVKTPEKWYGITYKEDLEEFQMAISDMKRAGIYPEHLY